MAHAELLYKQEQPGLFPKVWYVQLEAPHLLAVHIISDMSRQSLHQDLYKSFQYELERILRNQQVQDYFYNLYHFSNKNGVPMTFKYLFEYGEKEKLFSKEMYDKESYKDERNYFHRYIKF